MTPNEFRGFLACGSLLRWNKIYYLGLGPFAEKNPESLKFYTPDFFVDSDAKLESGTQSFELSESELLKLLEDFDEPSSRFTWQEPSFDDYQSAFEKIKSQMKTHKLKKAVPVLFAKAQGEFDLAQRARALRFLTKSPQQLWLYGTWTPDEGILGATPETLVTHTQGLLRSMALAGTQAKSHQECRLLSDPKERHEHDLTAQDIKKVLSSFGKVSLDGPKILELPNLWHLQTEISVQVREKIDLKALIKALHPTPALGVSPREFGYEFLRELPEASLRRRFGAPFAVEFSNGDFVVLVAIRNVQWNHGQVILGAGGGVVEASELEKEWLELAAKRKSVKDLMGL